MLVLGQAARLAVRDIVFARLRLPRTSNCTRLAGLTPGAPCRIAQHGSQRRQRSRNWYRPERSSDRLLPWPVKSSANSNCVGGTGPICSGGTWSQSANNQVLPSEGWTYDGAGNVLQVGSSALAFTYDAENRQVTANVNGSVSTYAPDGLGPKFTGQDRDQETLLDWFQVRSMSGAAGRFQSVDPGNAGADAGDPQTWNGYSYVGNNPLTFTDPSGMIEQAGGGSDGGAWGGLFAVGAEALYDGIKYFFSSGGKAPQPGNATYRQGPASAAVSRSGGSISTHVCPAVKFFVMQGNRRTIGKQGAFPGYKIQAHSAALDHGTVWIPQWSCDGAKDWRPDQRIRYLRPSDTSWK